MDSAKLVDDLGADSLDSMELITTFEEEFDIEISEEHAVEMKTIGDVVAHVNEELKRNNFY